MKTTAQLRHEASKARFTTAKGKATGNPLQLAAPEEELQMKKNPLQLAGPEEELQMKKNPLQMAAPEEELQMKKNPLQMAAPEEELQMKQNPLQMAAPEEEALQRKQNPLQLAAPEEELQMKQNPLQLAGGEEELPMQMKQNPLQLAGPEEELQMKQNPLQLAGPEEELQMKQNPVQLAAPEEELLQKKKSPFQLKGVEKSSINPFQLEEAPAKENKTGLPDHLKSGIENLSGYALDDVKVHYNSSQPAQLNAFAYAQGTDIHVGPGQEKHLPHEAWHVVQQKQGRVQPTRQMKAGVAVNDDPGLENEADVMGEKALNAGNDQTQDITQKKKEASDNKIAQLKSVTPVIQQKALIRDLPKNWKKSGVVKVSDQGGGWHGSVHPMDGDNSIFYEGFHVTGPVTRGKAPHFFYSGAGVYDQAESEGHVQSTAWRAAPIRGDWAAAFITATAKAISTRAVLPAELSGPDADAVLQEHQRRLAAIVLAEQQRVQAAAAEQAALMAGNSIKAWLHSIGQPLPLSGYYKGVAAWPAGKAGELAAYQAWCAANNRVVIP